MKSRIQVVFDHFEEYICFFLFCIMCVFVFLGIVTRYMLKEPIFFAGEMARYSYVWVCFVGLAVATKNESHVRVELLDHIVRGKGRRILKLLIDFGSFLILSAMAYLGCQYVGFSSVNRWPTLDLSMLYVTISYPIGCFLALMRLITVTRKHWKSTDGK